MEIDINIRNATPEEAQRVLIGMSFAEDILGKLSPAVRIEKTERPQVICDGCHPKPCSGCRFEREQCNHRPFAKGDHICRYFTERAPNPTCDEENGCAGCDTHGQDDEACSKCSPPPAPNKGRRPNKYGIPTELAKTDKKKYDRLWQRCKSHGIKYEAAMEMEGKTKRGRASKQLAQAIAPSNEVKAPKKPRVKHERLPLKMKNKEPEGTVIIRYTGLDQDLAAALPEERPPTRKQEKREVEKTMDGIKIGDRVRQIGGMKICTGIGEIKRAVPGSPEVLVAFANGQEWISRRNLAPVMA